MINATSIGFLRNLAQYDYNGQYFDFHNDYSCEKMSFSNEILLIMFKSLSDGALLSLKFTEVEFTFFQLFNIKDVEKLTLDTLYRGRVEINGNLVETAENDKGYFYLEFYEGQAFEFWAAGIDLERR